MKKHNFFKKVFCKKLDDNSDSITDLNLEEKDMIKGIVELSNTTVKEVMVPRIDVVFLSRDTEKNELLKTLIDCGHSRGIWVLPLSWYASAEELLVVWLWCERQIHACRSLVRDAWKR